MVALHEVEDYLDWLENSLRDKHRPPGRYQTPESLAVESLRLTWHRIAAELRADDGLPVQEVRERVAAASRGEDDLSWFYKQSRRKRAAILARAFPSCEVH